MFYMKNNITKNAAERAHPRLLWQIRGKYNSNPGIFEQNEEQSFLVPAFDADEAKRNFCQASHITGLLNNGFAFVRLEDFVTL